VRFPSFACKLHKLLPTIILARGDLNQSTRGKAAQDSTEISSIERQFRTQHGCGGLLAMDQFTKDPAFDEGKRSLQEVFVQNADALGVKAIEMPHGSNAIGNFAAILPHC